MNWVRSRRWAFYIVTVRVQYFLQKIVTLSTTEAEYVAVIETGKEMIWLHGFLDELGKK